MEGTVKESRRIVSILYFPPAGRKLINGDGEFFHAFCRLLASTNTLMKISAFNAFS